MRTHHFVHGLLLGMVGFLTIPFERYTCSFMIEGSCAFNELIQIHTIIMFLCTFAGFVQFVPPFEVPPAWLSGMLVLYMQSVYSFVFIVDDRMLVAASQDNTTLVVFDYEANARQYALGIMVVHAILFQSTLSFLAAIYVRAVMTKPAPEWLNEIFVPA